MSQTSIHHEDRRFFIQQFLKTMPLNVLAMGIKVLGGVFWAALDNARLLGFFSLASTPSSICQRASVTGALAQAILPNTKSADEDNAIVKTAIAVDVGLLAVSVVIMLAFFFVTRAEIIGHLGWPIFLVVSIMTLLEPLSGTAIHMCNAKRNYVWNFLLVNIRTVAVLAFLTFLYFRKEFANTLGVLVWAVSLLAASIGAFFYYSSAGLKLFQPAQRAIQGEFLENIKKNSFHLMTFRVSTILLGALPSFVVAYMENIKDVGAFAFAMTLSGLIYAAITPVIEQVYAPTFSKLVNADEHRLLMRRILQMSAIAIGLTTIASLVLLTAGKPVLLFFRKTAFLESFRFLPLLLAYQGLSMVTFGFTESLFCMYRFKALSALQFIGTGLALIWFLVFKGKTLLLIYALPLSSAVIALLSAIYVLKLTSSRLPLMRRSMYTAPQ